MSRRAAAILIVAIVGLGLGAGLLWRRAHRRPAAVPAALPVAPVAAPSSWPATLYFPSGDGRLVGEARDIQSALDPVARVRAVVTALLGGPQGGALYHPFPDGTTLGAVLVTTDKVAYVDLRGAQGAGPPGWGSTQELAAVYSLVDSVALNVPEASRVALLWNGVQPASLAGHLDLTHPLAASRALLAGSPAANRPAPSGDRE